MRVNMRRGHQRPFTNHVIWLARLQLEPNHFIPIMDSVTKGILLLSFLASSHLLIVSNSLMEEDGIRCDRLWPGNELDTAAAELTRQRSQSGGKETIYFGLMLSFPDPQGRPSFAASFDDGHDIAPAVYLAVKQVNNRTDLLKDYDVELLRLDGGCDVRGRTVVGVNELVCNRKNIVGIIGPSCRGSSRTVSQFTNHEDFSMITINYGGQNAGIGTYPYAFGILGSRAMHSMAFAELIKHNNWTRYAVLYSGSNLYYSNLGKGLLNSMTSPTDFPPSFTSTIYADSYIPLGEVKEYFLRVVIIIDSPRVILRTLCLAYHEGLVFPSYQWVFHGTVPQDFSSTLFTYQGRSYSCSKSEINISLNGSINFFLNALQDDGDEVTDTERDYRDGYELQTIAYSNESSVPSKTTEWAKGFYDAVWALAYALNSSLMELNSSLSDYELGSAVLAESIRSHMFDLEFRGVSGNIKFDSSTGFNEEGFFNVLQYKDNKSYTRIGLYKDGQLEFLPNISLSSIFIDSRFKEYYIRIDVSVAAAILTITAATLVLLISAQIVNTRYRNHRIIKASSPNFNHLIFIGGYTIIAGIVLYTVDNFQHIGETVQLHICNLVSVLLSAGVTLVLGTSCTKTWRLNRIYVHSKRCDNRDIKSIKGYVLVGFICALVAVDLLVCTLWRTIDPLTSRMNQTLNILKVGDEPVMVVDSVCHSAYEEYWLVVLTIPKVLLILASFLLALKTQINITEFKISNAVILSYCLTVLFCLGLPTYIVIHFAKVSVLIAVEVISISLNLLIWVCIIIILILPLIKSTRINSNVYHSLGLTK